MAAKKVKDSLNRNIRLGHTSTTSSEISCKIQNSLMTWKGDLRSCNVLSNVAKDTAQTMTSTQHTLIILTKPNIFLSKKHTQKIALSQVLRTE